MSMDHKNIRDHRRRVAEGDVLVSGLVGRAERGAVIIITDQSVRVDRSGESLYGKEEAGNPEGQE